MSRREYQVSRMDDGAKEAKETEKEIQLIGSFLEISSSSRSEAVFFLESHNWDLDAALSAFLDNDSAHRSPSPAPAPAPAPAPSLSPSPSASASISQSQSQSEDQSSPSRSRSPSPGPTRPRDRYQLRSRKSVASSDSGRKGPTRGRGGIRTLSDLNRTAGDGSDSDSDGQEYYTGGEKRYYSLLRFMVWEWSLWCLGIMLFKLFGIMQSWNSLS